MKSTVLVIRGYLKVYIRYFCVHKHVYLLFRGAQSLIRFSLCLCFGCRFKNIYCWDSRHHIPGEVWCGENRDHNVLSVWSHSSTFPRFAAYNAETPVSPSTRAKQILCQPGAFWHAASEKASDFVFLISEWSHQCKVEALVTWILQLYTMGRSGDTWSIFTCIYVVVSQDHLHVQEQMHNSV